MHINKQLRSPPICTREDFGMSRAAFVSAHRKSFIIRKSTIEPVEYKNDAHRELSEPMWSTEGTYTKDN